MKYLKQYELFTSVDMEARNKEMIGRFQKATVVMNEDESVDFVINHCSEWLKYPVGIERGIDNYLQHYFYSEPIERYSRDNANFYTLIIDNAPSWRGYPKRSKSFICSIHLAHLGEYTYLVIPEDGSKWGVAPCDDIFQAFTELPLDANDFFDTLDNIAYDYGIELYDTDYKLFKKGIEELQKEISISGFDPPETTFKERRQNELRELLSSNNIWLKLMKLMNPKRNGFELMDLKGLYTNRMKKLKNSSAIVTKNSDKVLPGRDFENNEIWTDSPCVFINKTKNFLEILRKQTHKNIILV